jgi:uncharacterized DUF497 family protein
MKFTWDDEKRTENIKKHGLDFIDAEIVFSGVTYTIGDNRHFYGEQRFITIGLLHNIVVVIAHTEANKEIRVISMRKATKNEQKLYFKGFSY